MKKVVAWIVCGMLLCGMSGCDDAAPSPTYVQETAQAVRAVWIPYMETAQLAAQEDPRKAIADCMEDCAARGADTVYFHVRANSDAYYASTVYPPTADTAACLQRGIDPLAVAVEEAHARGLALHAWINPYRIGADVTRAVTEDRFCFGDRWYYIPTADSTHRLVLDGVREIVTGYAVDGVQFDDYFYPVGAVEKEIPAVFEEAAFAHYREDGGALTVADWRRAAVDRLIAAVYAVCHSREGCVFGVSPASNLTQVREGMYADAARWMAVSGYVDYICPQLYFGFSHESAPFEGELARWSALPRHGECALIAGLALYKTGMPADEYAGSGKSEWASGGDIIARQIRAVCEAGWQGTALYSHLSFEPTESRDATVVQQEVAAVQKAWNEMKTVLQIGEDACIMNH